MAIVKRAERRLSSSIALLIYLQLHKGRCNLITKDQIISVFYRVPIAIIKNHGALDNYYYSPGKI